ncbi:MAG: family 10 glycosylhydrolase [Myxococcota bacterium]
MRLVGVFAAALAPWLLACGGAPEAPSPAPVEAPRRALWVLAEGSQRVLENPARLDGLLEDAAQLGVTDLFVQVYRGGRAWFDSSRADAGPYRALVEKNGGDTLRELLDRAHGDGLRVHAWVNVLSNANRRETPPVEGLGREATQVDRMGRSVLDYPDLEVPPPDRSYYRMGTPAVWLDPAVPGVVEHLVGTFTELVERYPGLDGLHLDYIRYPDVLPFIPGSRFGVGLEFGFGEVARRRFREETGVQAPAGTSTRNANRFDDWRRAQVTGLVARIRESTRAVDPDLALSAAVWAWPDRAYLSMFQDWRGWLESGLLEFAVPMLYTRDERLLRYNSRAFTRGVGGERVWIGLGAWLFSRQPETAVEQLREVSALEPAGVALFSWDALADAPELRDALAEESGRGG